MRVVLLSFVLCACGSVEKSRQDAAPTRDAPVTIDAAPDAPGVAPTLDMAMGPTQQLDAEGDTAQVSVRAHGAPSQNITVTFTASLGSYAPAQVQVTTDATGYATATSTYTSNGAGNEQTSMVASVGSLMSSPATLSWSVTALARYGYTTAFATSGSFGANFLLGQAIQVTTAGHLKKLGFISMSAGPNIKVGIYTDAAGKPGTLIAQIPATAVAQGTNEVALAAPVQLAIGTYWFEAVYDNTGNVFQDGAGGNSVQYASQTFANALPATFPAPSTYSGNHFNYYLVLGQ